MKQKKRVGGTVGMLLLMIFLYAPIIYPIFYSFNAGSSLTVFKGFSLQWYEKMFQDRSMMNAIVYTVVIAVIATTVSVIVGTITAIGLSKSNPLLRTVVSQVNELPMMNPDIVTAIGLLMLFTTLKVEKGFATMLLAHIMFCIPYVILSITPRLRSLDPNLADAAMDLGATPVQALVKVVVPQLLPGIISGALIAFTMSFDDFVISYFATDNGVNNISIVVYAMRKRVNPSIYSLATLVTVLIALGLTIYNLISWLAARRRAREEAAHEAEKLRAAGADL